MPPKADSERTSLEVRFAPKPGTTGTGEKDAKDAVEYLGFLMRVMYDVPDQIKRYRTRNSAT